MASLATMAMEWRESHGLVMLKWLDAYTAQVVHVEHGVHVGHGGYDCAAGVSNWEQGWSLWPDLVWHGMDCRLG